MAEKSEISQILWIGKALFRKGTVLFVRFVGKAPRTDLSEELYWILEELSNQRCNLGSLRSGQGDVGEEWMALEGFDHGYNPVMPSDSKVVPLGNIMGQDDSRTLADPGEHS